MAKCLLCKTELKDIKVTVIQNYEIVKSSKVPYGWLYLSPDETDPALVDIHQIPMLKETTGIAVCGKCGAECKLVASGEEFITVSSLIE